jgi:hypothetical protein
MIPADLSVEEVGGFEAEGTLFGLLFHLFVGLLGGRGFDASEADHRL